MVRDSRRQRPRRIEFCRLLHHPRCSESIGKYRESEATVPESAGQRGALE
jgi:hypothetical protein